MTDIPELTYNKDGLIPVIVQDYRTNEVLMMAYSNEEAVKLMYELLRYRYALPSALSGYPRIRFGPPQGGIHQKGHGPVFHIREDPGREPH